MSTSIDQAFIKQYEAEVHEAYQRMGSKLRGTVRTKSGIVGQSTTFQTVGKGAASTKSRHGLVPVMNVDHTPVECTLADYYAGDWVDKLDELKTNIDERQVTVNAGAYALGRKTDDLIINALENATQGTSGGGAGSGATIAKVFEALEQLNDNDVPDDGQRYGWVGNKQWNELMQAELGTGNFMPFSQAEYIGYDDLPFKGGIQAKRWLGVIWMAHSGLPLSGGDIRSCFVYHRSAVGHAIGAEVTTDITWHGDRAAHFISNSMSQGAVLIDGLGAFEILCDESP